MKLISYGVRAQSVLEAVNTIHVYLLRQLKTKMSSEIAGAL